MRGARWSNSPTRHAPNFREAQSVKRDLIESIVADWSAEDIAHFGRLYLKFVEEFEQMAKSSEV